MIRLVAFDIDGTLFDEQRWEYPKGTVEALRLLKQNGIMSVATTGRPPDTAVALRTAGIDVNYYVCSNGHILMLADGTILEEEGFSAELVEDVWQFCKAKKIALMWKYPDGICAYSSNEEFERIFDINRRLASMPINICLGDDTVHRTRSPNGGCVSASAEKLAHFNKVFEGRCRAVDINGKTSDLLRWDVNKQTGLARLLKRIGVKPEECMAFGDNRNDIEILHYVGIGVAMGNGEMELKACSDYVTEAVDANGIYLALKHFNLI